MKLVVRICLPLFVLAVFGGLFLFAAPSDTFARDPISGCASFGDVTNDGVITSADSSYILSNLLGQSPGGGLASIRADVDDDDAITSVDAQWVLNYANFTPGWDPFPVCNGKKLNAPQCSPSGDVYAIGQDLNKISAFDPLYVLEDEAHLGTPLTWQQREQGDVLNHGSPVHIPSNPTYDRDLDALNSADALKIFQYKAGLLSPAQFYYCPFIEVYSTGASNVIITGSRPNTGGTTYYKTPPTAWTYLDTTISTTLTAPVISGFNFVSWTGECAFVDNAARRCDVSLVNDVYPRTFDNPDPIQARTVTANYVVAPVGQPDYVPRNLSGPASVCVNQPATYTFETYNQGSGAATTSSDTLVWANPQYRFDPVGPLAAGASVFHSFTTSWSTVSGRWVVGQVDYNSTVPESDENNNQASMMVSVEDCVPPPPLCTVTPGTNFLRGCYYDTPAVADPNLIEFLDPSVPTPDGPTLSSPVQDSVVALDLNAPVPSQDPPGPNWFSGRLEGDFTFKAGTYTFYLGSDDGGRLYIDGTLQEPNRWYFTGWDETSYEVTFTSQASRRIKVEYFQGDGERRWSLYWTYAPPVAPPDLDDLTPRVYHTSGPYVNQTVSSTRPADPREPLRGQIRFYENTNKPPFQFNAHWWANTGAIAEGSCDTSGTRESGIWTNGWNTTTYDVYFDAPGSPGTYEFWEYLDADCNIAEVSEVNNAEGVAYQVAAASCTVAPGTNFLRGCYFDTPAVADPNLIEFLDPSVPTPDGPTLSSPVQDSVVALDLNAPVPSQDPPGPNWFSGRLEGDFTFKAGTYTFYLGSDDGGRLYIDGTLQEPNRWYFTGWDETSYEVTFTSQASRRIKVEYFQGDGERRWSLYWTYVPPSLPDLNAQFPRVYHRFGTWAGLAVSSTYPATTNEQLRGEIRFTESTDKPQFSFNARWWSNIGIVTSGTCFTTGGSLASGILTNGNSGVTVYGDEPAEEINMHFDAPATAGTYNFYEYLDADGSAPACAIAEVSEDNNVEKTVFAYDVVEPVALNLTVTRFELFKTDCTTPLGSPLIGEDVCFVADVKNTSGNNITTPFTIAFWIDHSDPGCGDDDYDALTNVLSLGAGATKSWSGIRTVPPPTGAKFAKLFADQGCVVAESDEADNIGRWPYFVGTNNWLQAVGGDVGAVGRIDMSNPPASPKQTDYLLIGRDIGDASSDRWKVNNYIQPLVPTGGVYDYFNNRFGAKARANAAINCASDTIVEGFNYCGNGDVTLSSLAVSGNGSHVIFVDGNLVIAGNIDIGSASVVFVVKNNIVVWGGNIIDGVYIAGAQFLDCFLQSCSAASPLTVKGAVYANSMFVSKSRALASGGGPSLIVNFEPKYLVEMNDLLGSPSIVWREVAP